MKALELLGSCRAQMDIFDRPSVKNSEMMWNMIFSMLPYLEHTINCKSRYFWIDADNEPMDHGVCDCGLDDLLEPKK